jgi:hypothetical protein
MKTKPILYSYKFLYLLVLPILIQIFIGGCQYLCSNEKNTFNSPKTIYDCIIEKYFNSNYQSADDLPINNEDFEIEKDIDDYHKPTGHSVMFNNYQIKSKHCTKIHPFYIAAFHPEIIPPPPKTGIQNS